MSRYQAIEQLHHTIGELERSLSVLRQQLQQLRLLAARVFVLPEVARGKEHNPRPRIEVTQLLAQAALTQALHHFGLLFMQQQSAQRSTKSAVRLPGALCLEAQQPQAEDLRRQVAHINQLKRRLEQIITIESGVAAEERFEFVHQQLPGLITLNAYRAITLLEAPDSVRFGWANKQIIKKVNRAELREKLLASLKSGRSAAGWDRESWTANLQQEIALLEALPDDVQLKIRRPVKVQPIARIWQADKQKQTQLACPSPLLIICQDASQLPALGELLNYDENNISHRHKPAAQTLWPLIPRLHLFVDRPQ
ncbi:DNA replication terminus site-binding protein [Izhakiella australiensis]|uniref:DNA replication terminus site-binding protein n=1 Tax=Izhakiella australiensis TaxID=1926881 RepID=A0A1S8YNS4_9GAMM|nr:DNA replication terminus site-binding protein [Izhakiella australiensis]OON40406.1 DNA replication terminus site-binding protein [Izhakiella australiensis]